MDRLISEQTVFKIIDSLKANFTCYDWVTLDEVASHVKAIPSAEPKTGHWKRISMDKYTTHAQYWYRCDRCGKDNLGNTDWCPSCGARMLEPEESEVRNDKRRYVK